MDRVARLCADTHCPQTDKARGTPAPEGLEEAGQNPLGSSVESGQERRPVRLLA